MLPPTCSKLMIKGGGSVLSKDVEGRSVQLPYTTGLGPDNNCIRHADSATKVTIGKEFSETHCVYLYTANKSCEGPVDETIEAIPDDGEYSSRWTCRSTDTRPVGASYHFWEPAVASVVKVVSSLPALLLGKVESDIMKGKCLEAA